MVEQAKEQEKRIIRLTADDLERTYQDMTAQAICECTFITACVGGVPATEDGVAAYVKYQLKLEGEDAAVAVQRIMKEEIGERAIKQTNGEELPEREVYGINCVRHDQDGTYLGNWMIKACLKAAASRIGLFVAKRGTKGDMAEMGRCLAYGDSLRTDHKRIYIVGEQTHFERFTGNVSTVEGKKSIVHWSEVIPAGSKFSFEYRFVDARINDVHLKQLLAAASNIGIGSVKALERGKFRIDNTTITRS
jgi:hypothetical protein